MSLSLKKGQVTFFFACLLLSSSLALAAISPEEFLSSLAASAFKAGEYEEALKGFQALLEKYPGDLTILRYIGISYDRLEQDEEAVATFRKGLALDPKNAALHYFLGGTLFKMRDSKQATEAFRKAIELAPGSLYTKQAQQYLEAMNQQMSQDEPTGGPKRWDLLAQVGFQWDNNIPSAPRRRSLFPGPHEGFRATEQFSAGYQLKYSGWAARIGFSTYQSQHTEGRFNDLDLSTYQPSFEVSYVTTLAEMPVSPSLRYEFNDTLLKGDHFSKSHSVTAKVDANVVGNWIISPFYRFTVDKFQQEGFDPRFSSRDAKNHVGGATIYYLFWQRRGNVRFGYEFQRNGAKGANFDLSGHKGTVGLTVPLIAEINFDFSGELSGDRHPHFRGVIGDPRTRQQVYSASLSRGFWNLLFLSLSYQYTLANSKYGPLEYDRNIVALTGAVKF